VTSYKELQGRDGYKFHYCHAHARVKVEHAFGVLKEHFKAIPMRIRSVHDHSKAFCWVECFLYIAQLYTDS
jgi:hypothetical protein